MKGKKSSFYSFEVKSKQVAIMAKRILEDLKGEHYQIDFKHDQDESQLRKKIKLENDIIIDKIKEHYEDIDISEHEVQKFLLIFHSLMEAINSLKLPAILKSALKKVKNLFNVEKTNEDAQRTTETQTSSETSGDRAKEQ